MSIKLRCSSARCWLSICSGIEPQGQQGLQVIACIGLVGLLRQLRFAGALGGVGFAVGVQRAGQFAEDLAHRLAGLQRCRVLALARSVALPAFGGLLVAGVGGLPSCFIRLPPGLCLGRQVLRGMLHQFVNRLRLVPLDRVVAQHLAKQGLGVGDLQFADVGLRDVAVPDKDCLDLGIKAVFEQLFGQLWDPGLQLAALRLGQFGAVRLAYHQVVEKPEERQKGHTQAGLQRLELGGLELVVACAVSLPLGQQLALLVNLPDQPIEGALCFAQLRRRRLDRHQRIFAHSRCACRWGLWVVIEKAGLGAGSRLRIKGGAMGHGRGGIREGCSRLGG